MDAVMWKSLTHKRTGLHHIQEHTECQDALQIKETESCIVVALADGVGSLADSSIAAQTAVNAVCEQLAEQEEVAVETLAEQLTAKVCQAVEAAAKILGKDINQMDCTLAFVYLSKKTNQAIIGSLGDSAVCVIYGTHTFVLSQYSPYANLTATLFNHQLEQFVLQKVSLKNIGLQGFVLTSDGLEYEIYTKGETKAQKECELYFNAALLPEGEQIIAQRVNELTGSLYTQFTDDISVVVLSRAETSVIMDETSKWLCYCGKKNWLRNTYCEQCGADFMRIYASADFSKAGGKAQFFEAIENDADGQCQALGFESSKQFYSLRGKFKRLTLCRKVKR